MVINCALGWNRTVMVMYIAVLQSSLVQDDFADVRTVQLH